MMGEKEFFFAETAAAGTAEGLPIDIDLFFEFAAPLGDDGEGGDDEDAAIAGEGVVVVNGQSVEEEAEEDADGGECLAGAGVMEEDLTSPFVLDGEILLILTDIDGCGVEALIEFDGEDGGGRRAVIGAGDGGSGGEVRWSFAVEGGESSRVGAAQEDAVLDGVHVFDGVGKVDAEPGDDADIVAALLAARHESVMVVLETVIDGVESDGAFVADARRGAGGSVGGESGVAGGESGVAGGEGGREIEAAGGESAEGGLGLAEGDGLLGVEDAELPDLGALDDIHKELKVGEEMEHAIDDGIGEGLLTSAGEDITGLDPAWILVMFQTLILTPTCVLDDPEWIGGGGGCGQPAPDVAPGFFDWIHELFYIGQEYNL